MSRRWLSLVIILLFFLISASPVFAETTTSSDSSMPWWAWPLILFVVTFILGILAVLGGSRRWSVICSSRRRFFPI